MSKIFTSLLAVAASLTAVSALPSELDSRAVTGNFSLFAYGSDSDTTIGGYPIFYHDGIAYIANPALVNRTADYAVFSKFFECSLYSHHSMTQSNPFCPYRQEHQRHDPVACQRPHCRPHNHQLG